MSAAAAEKRNLRLRAGETFRFPDGTRVVAEKRLKPKKKGGLKTSDETVLHEIKHAVVAWRRRRKVLFITSIPGRTEDGLEYMGLTITDTYDPIAAAAPHAHGHDGTVGDRANMEHHGHDIDAASGDARDVMADLDEHIVAGANALAAKGTLSGNEFESIMDWVEENLEDEYEVVVKIFPPDGKTEVRPAEDMPRNNELTIVNIASVGDVKTENSFTPKPDFAFAD